MSSNPLTFSHVQSFRASWRETLKWVLLSPSNQVGLNLNGGSQNVIHILRNPKIQSIYPESNVSHSERKKLLIRTSLKGTIWPSCRSYESDFSIQWWLSWIYRVPIGRNCVYAKWKDVSVVWPLPVLKSMNFETLFKTKQRLVSYLSSYRSYVLCSWSERGKQW